MAGDGTVGNLESWRILRNTGTAPAQEIKQENEQEAVRAAAYLPSIPSALGLVTLVVSGTWEWGNPI
jgi:hypothetical protein